MIFADSATFIDEHINVPAVIIEEYKSFTNFVTLLFDPLVNFTIEVNLFLLSPGLILSGL